MEHGAGGSYVTTHPTKDNEITENSNAALSVIDKWSDDNDSMLDTRAIGQDVGLYLLASSNNQRNPYINKNIA